MDYINDNNNCLNKPLKVNIYDLYKNINEKKEKKLSNFNEILYKIHNKIKKASDLEKYSIIFQVPEFIFGIPNYSIDKCTAYLIKELRMNGFLVKYYFPKILYISWNPIEIKQSKKERKFYKENLKTIDKNIYELPDLNKKYQQSRLNLDNKIIHNKINSITENKNIPNNLNISNNDIISLQSEATQYKNEVFKPILKYNPNVIPTYNYYAYSSLNQNVVNEENQNNNIMNSIKDSSNVELNNYNHSNISTIINNAKILETQPKRKTNIDNKFNKFIENKQKKEKLITMGDNKITREDINNHYKNVTDYYDENENNNENDIDVNKIPFKNTIQNSKGKFVLDLR
jgi:hypothetical protein